MKKLVFDDFQPDSGKKYVVEEIPDTHVSPSQMAVPVEKTQMPRKPALGPFASIKPETKPVAREFQVSDFFDVDADIFNGTAEPRAEFDFLLEKVLLVIKEVVFAQSVIFFWANRDKQQMVMEVSAGDGPPLLAARRFQIGYDLVSKVARAGKPELVTEVNELSQAELIRYYEGTANVKSFAGVPVYYAQPPGTRKSDLPVAVIAIDSAAEGAFGEETLLLLGQYTKLISGLLKSYTEKYDLLLESELLSSMRKTTERLRSDFSLTTITLALGEEASKLVSFDFLSIILYDEAKHAWRIKKIINRIHEPYVGPEQIIDYPSSIAAQAIRSNTVQTATPVAQADLPRFYKDEKAGTNGLFLAVPISSLNKCYGALCIERRDAAEVSQAEIEVLSRMVEHAASSLEILYMNEIIREYVIIDDTTGAYSRKFILQKFDEELQRADDSGTELSLLLVTVDHTPELQQRFGQEGFDRIMSSLAKAIRSSVRVYDLVGRLESNQFSILLINTAANEAYLWAEKIRKNVAGHVITIEERSFAITISIGVSGALEGMKKDVLMRNAAAVLQKAIDAGGNGVRVY